eukprot:jgi/Botrbrau1/20135/Bobra.0173s0037.1
MFALRSVQVVCGTRQFSRNHSVRKLTAITQGRPPTRDRNFPYPGKAMAALDPVGVYGSKEKADEILLKARETITSDIPANMVGPLLRMSFHDAGTFEKDTKTGGANGSLRFEVFDPFSAGMETGFALLKQVYHKLQEEGYPITWADLFQVGGATMTERAGGPHIPVEMGRRDSDELDNGFKEKLPSEQSGPQQLIANMESHGFTKQEIVAISGAHTVGSSKHHKPLGPMKVPETMSVDDIEKNTFNNKYYATLLEAKQGRFPSDTALIQDPEMLKWVEVYAKDQDIFFKDFSDVFLKMGTLGVNT